MATHEKNITIQVTSGTIFKMFAIAALFYTLFVFKDLLLVILTAVVIASAIDPAARWFQKRKIPRVVGVIAVYATLSLVFGSILYTFVPTVITEVVNIDRTYELSDAVSEYVGDEAGEGVAAARSFSLNSILGELQQSFSGNPEDAIQTINRIFGGLFSFILIIVFSFYLSVQDNGVRNFLRIITPNKHEKYVIGLWHRTQQKIGLWMQGQLLLGLIVGVLVYLGLVLMQVPYALLLAVIAGLFEIIPIFGPVLAAIPAILLGYNHGVDFIAVFEPGVSAAIVVALFYVLIQQFENHLIYPLVVQKVVGVPPLLVIIALVVGAQAAGFLGIILAIPMAAALMEFTNDLEKEKDLTREGK
jgi:predicted PurR-regulated permease PerM